MRIDDHAILGDCRSAALVTRGGAIDWLCWPRFDSPPVFARVLDPRGGAWTLCPSERARATRRYVEDTNVLETRFETNDGVLLVTDLMPALSDDYKKTIPVADHEVIRLVRCERGEIELAHDFDPRVGYGTAFPKMHDGGALGLRVVTKQGLLTLRSDIPRDPKKHGDDLLHTRVRMRAGDRYTFSLTFSVDGPAILPPLGPPMCDVVDRSIAWWRDWARRLVYDGPARAAVVRSALALRLLVYAPSGAIVAAPTTSLPERIGGDLNWDYRFCWLRDASFTVRALFGLGCHEEASAFVSWLLHTTRLTRPGLRILYDVYGRRPAPETTVDALEGFSHSHPVRVGNDAGRQLQLDVYGEVIEATARFAREGGDINRDMLKTLAAWGEWLCIHWDQPDEGIWEPRSGRRRNTHSRLLAWTALDRLLELDRCGLSTSLCTRLESNRAILRREIEEHAWNERLGSYVSTIDGTDVDATLLLLPWYGLEHADSERMKRTYARIVRELGTGDGLLYRYRNGDSPGEGAFGICGFWGAEYLAMGGGSYEDAESLFHRLCSYANDVGLLGEEIDPETGAALGNFPQAFTHVGLINAALTLNRRLHGESKPHPRAAEGPHAARPRPDAELHEKRLEV